MVRIVSIDRYIALWQQQIFQIEHLKHFIDSTKCDRSTFSHFVVLLKQFSPVMLLYFVFFSTSHNNLVFFVSSFTHSFTFFPFLYVFLQAMLLQYIQFARFVFIFFFVLLFQCMCDWHLSIFTKVFYNFRELIYTYTYIDHVCMICDTIQSN